MHLEKENTLNEAYRQFIQYGIGKMPIDLYETLAVEDYMGYGTALDEKLFSSADLRDLVVRQLEQGRGMDIQFVEKPVFRRLSVSEDVAIIVAELTVTIKDESIHHEMLLRFTTVMEYFDDRWKAVHSHGSRPENVLSESDTWHINEWKRKNEELQKLVDEKTADLAGKNQELVIEACLERVRTQAMSMKVPEDMPEVCRIIAEQLILLGVKDIRNIQTAIFYPEKGTYLNFEYYCLYDKKLISEINFKLPEQEIFANKMMNEPGAFLEEHFSGKELSDWLAYQEKTNQFVDLHLYTTESVSYYFYSLGPVSLGISTYAHLKPGDLELMKRFRNVFELAYTRYLDIQQAEAQAKEAQIELALERVRARTMAMQHSEELKEAANLLFQQVHALGIPAWSCGYNIWDKNEKEYKGWMSTQGSIQPSFSLKVTENPSFIRQFESRQRGDLFYAEEMSGQALVDHYNYMNSLPDFKPILEGFINAGYSLPESQVNNVANFSHGNLIFITSKPVPESWDIFKRFAKVFEQTFTRFLDLQKAEEQAKDAEIELALERVRARTMAMQKSEDLPDAANLLFQQMQSLGMPAWSAGYCIWDENKQGVTLWMSSEGVIQPPFHAPLNVDPTFIHMREAHERGETFHVEAVGGDELVAHYKYMRTLPVVGRILASIIDAGHPLPVFQIMHCAYFSQGFLLFITYEPMPQAWDIFKRFAKVFDQTYTRFLDLQKAEAQAREAQIETSLERVRSHSLAMHHSEELEQVVGSLFDQLVELGLLFDGASIFLFDKGNRNIHLWVASKISTPLKVMMPYDENIMANQIIIDLWNANEKGEDIINKSYSGGIKDEYTHYVGKYNELIIPEWIRKMMLEAKSWTVSYAVEKNSLVCIDSWTGQFMTVENFRVVKRFAKVFEQAYTRFLDLQKAESQAKEAQIEAALEKVRSTSLAMHKAEELKNVVSVVFQKLKDLGLTFDVAGIQLYAEGSKDIIQWVAAPDLLAAPILTNLPFVEKDFSESEIVRDYWAAKEMGKSFSNKSYSFDEKNKFFEYAGRNNDFTVIPEGVREFQLKAPGYTQTLIAEKRSAVWVDSYSGQAIPGEAIDILKRFSRIFEQAYVRFLDLQKAEKQARDAEIELALERVRAKTMAIQKSDELNEIVYEVYRQIRSLNFQYGGCTIIIMDHNSGDMVHWLAGFEQGKYPAPYAVRNISHPLHEAQIAAWKEGKKFATFELFGEELETYAELMFTQSGYKNLPDEEKNRLRSRENTIFNLSYMNCGALMWAPSLLTDEQIDIMQRFAKVFDQSYARFQDIQKAEAQAREAHIEAALERVRSRAMAMQKSSELSTLIELVYKEMGTLDIVLQRCFIMIFDPSSNSFTWWMASNEAGSSQRSYLIPYHEHKPHLAYIKGWKEQNARWMYILEGAEKEEWDEFLFKKTELTELPQPIIQNMTGTAKAYLHSSFSHFGCICAASVEPLEGDYFEIFNRFSKVFDQTYTRFLDLQNAEAQARDAQVEAALEKVRSRTMAMQKSDELADAAYVLFQQLNHLGVIHERINIGIVKEETNTIDFWITEQGGNQINTRFSASLHEPTTISKVYAAWKAGQKSMIVDLTGEELKAWLKYLTEVIGIPFDPAFTHNRRVQTAGSFSKGMLVLTTPEPLPEESIHLLEKFAGVFDLTYTRFNDLLMAEAQTHKANIEVALERVRARALAMQEPEELIEVAEVLRHEMGLLGVEELETSSIYLHDDNSDSVECWYAISDIRHPEKKLVADQINIDLQKTWVGRQMFDFYESDKNQISILMQGANRIEWIKYCASVSTVLGDFYGESIPDRTYHLYKFSNGAIGAAAAGDISPESWELLSRTASVFSLAYSRFKDLTKARIDLQKLKEEKQRAELALTDLKAAQSQLVQAEKMASLGELTAGIAHEIQNPLNFVNNFSELSNELIEEMQEEMDKGNSDEVKNIVADIRSNLEKINLHGKRADAIVKGMLQHSRTTSGEKQPTDINALAEEYLRLAYHGLRAKDKNFNVILKTEYDAFIGNINIIPQDIGRVLLNLINNAFYAVSEKQKREIEGFEPVVIISTKKLIDKVQIEVRDNGNGIPENIYAKIFQPFFTTKPTGLGTGLGLSLSYDIVKAHGGELRVETKEGEGSEFIIQLPIV